MSRVLVVMSGHEFEAFFPNRTPDDALREAWVDLASDGTSLARLIEERRPRVLMAGWSTPLLEERLTSPRGGCVEYVCQVTGSVRHVVPRDAIAAGLRVSNWGALVAPIVAEHALLLVLAALRNLGQWQQFLRDSGQRWVKSRLSTRCLRGRRVAIYGCGAIARALVQLLEPFDTQVWIFSPGLNPTCMENGRVGVATSLLDLCGRAEVFVCCEALTTATRDSINAEVLECLPHGSVFVNVARGALVDEAALHEAVRRRGLRVASDVFVQEPLAPDSPWFGVPGAVLSPHIAGPTHDYYGICGEHALGNVRRFLAGLDPAPLFDVATYDRST